MLRRRWRSSRSVAVVSGIPGVRASPIDSRVNSTSGHAAQRDRPLRCARAPGAPRPDPDRRLRAAVWNNDYGLPYVWSLDEGSHFASRSVEMFWQDFDPGYYQNPAAYTYLLYGLLRAMYGPLGFVFDLPFGNITEQFGKDPTEIWVAARTLAAVLCMAGRGGHLLGRAAHLGRPRGRGGGGGALLRLPAGGLLARRGDRRGIADRRGAGAVLRRCGPTRRAACATSRWPAPPPGWPWPSSTRPGWRCCPWPSPRSRRLPRRPRPGGGRRWPPGRAGRWCSSSSTPTCCSFGDRWTDLRDQAEVAADQSKPGQDHGGVGYYLESLAGASAGRRRWPRWPAP